MVALITGGSSGMGLEFARQLAGRGYDLVLVSNQEQALAEAAQALSATVTVRTRCQDLAQERSADELFALCGEDRDAFLSAFCARRLTYGDIEGAPAFREGIANHSVFHAVRSKSTFRGDTAASREVSNWPA